MGSSEAVKPKLASKYRTHTCRELGSEAVGSEVVLSGWVMRKRDHGGVVFVDLRDHYGITQVVFADALREEIQATRVESVILVRGKVVKRDPELVNEKLKTGEVEVHVDSFELLSAAAVLPFVVNEEDSAPESIRLQHRFLELRREKLHKNIQLRCEAISAVREILTGLGLNEFQTPILTSSSPEGARDFIVPSRLHPGKFFALPQAPQIFKQLIMTAGFDRYFQIAPCFRDEDPRADRSPGEFYQIDMELSFVTQDEVFAVNESLFTELFSRFTELPYSPAPFQRIPYAEALSKYGSDKPDLRNSLLLDDVSEVFKESEFRVFRGVIDDGGSVRAIHVDLQDHDGIPPRKYFDDAIANFKRETGKGLAYLSFVDGEWKGSIRKFISDSELDALKAHLNVTGTSSVFFAAGKDSEVLKPFGRFRETLGRDFNKIDEDRYEFCWITDYPLYELDETTGKIEFSHNPFSMPQGGLKDLEEKHPLDVYATQYDLVCNGYELGSGAIRNHLPEVMYKAFEIVGHSREVVDEKFSGLINAFQFGAPPHGGVAFGMERIVMLLAREKTIRDVILFPFAQTAEDLMMKAPSELEPVQLKEVHIQLDLPEEVLLEQEKVNG